MKRSMSAHYRVGFLQYLRAMRDGFYDSALNNKDWNKIKDKYQEMAAMPSTVIRSVGVSL